MPDQIPITIHFCEPQTRLAARRICNVRREDECQDTWENWVLGSTDPPMVYVPGAPLLVPVELVSQLSRVCGGHVPLEGCPGCLEAVK
jgi:hypothetical protein